MKRFVESESRLQSTLFPDQLGDYISEDNPVFTQSGPEKDIRLRKF